MARAAFAAAPIIIYLNCQEVLIMWSGIGTSLVGAGLGGAIDLGTSLFGTSTSKDEARAADKRAYQNQKKLFNYQTTMGPWLSRQGLEAAGYNPMLALSQGQAHMPGFASHSGSPDTKSGSAASMARMMYDASLNKTRAEIENIKQDTALKSLQGLEATSRTRLNDTVDERTELNKWTDVANALTHGGTAIASGYLASKLSGANSRSRRQRPNPPPRPPRSSPVLFSTPTAKPNVPSSVSGSASSASRVASILGASLRWSPVAAIGAGLGYLEGKNVERDMKRGNHWDPKDKSNPKEKARRWWSLYQNLPF